MLLKLYTVSRNYFGEKGELKELESLHIIDEVTDIVVHQDTYTAPVSKPAPGDKLESTESSVLEDWGPQPFDGVLIFKGGSWGGKSKYRVVDYTRNGIRYRLPIQQLCYVCNDQGKTIERVQYITAIG